MQALEHLNSTLFLIINASLPARPALVASAMFFAEYLIWAIPLGLTAAWLLGPGPWRRAAFRATLAAMLAFGISYAIGVMWPHPRPFVLGLGTNLLAHAPDSSFPSDHLTLWWVISFSLLAPQRGPSSQPGQPGSRLLRGSGLVLALLGLPIAWARIYLGVHYPLDMLGALLVALVGATGIALCEGRLFDTLFGASVRLYRFAFAPLIRLGCAKR
jgi:undecaprenyl-diphosphatase